MIDFGVYYVNFQLSNCPFPDKGIFYRNNLAKNTKKSAYVQNHTFTNYGADIMVYCWAYFINFLLLLN